MRYLIWNITSRYRWWRMRLYVRRHPVDPAALGLITKEEIMYGRYTD